MLGGGRKGMWRLQWFVELYSETVLFKNSHALCVSKTDVFVCTDVLLKEATHSFTCSHQLAALALARFLKFPQGLPLSHLVTLILFLFFLGRFQKS